MTHRIGLDLTCLSGERTGMARQAQILAERLPSLAPEITFVYFLERGVAPPSAAANVEFRELGPVRGPGGRVAREQLALARSAAGARLNLLHSPAYGAPLLYRGRRLLTLHDFGLWVHPKTAPLRWRLYWRAAYETAARFCPLLIAVSECTMRDAVQYLHRDPASIRVVHCGLETRFTPAPPGHDSRGATRALGLPERYILSVGTIQPRKDLLTLLDAFARLRALGADHSLVIVGGRGWGYSDLDGELRRRGLATAVHLTGFVPDEALPDIYRAADLLLFTSIYEGFGLPLVEAMASGTPVVAPANSAIPEVVGGAALLAPAGDADALAEAAGRLLTNGDLRDRCVRLGEDRARRFSGDRAARGTLAVYREVLGGDSVTRRRSTEVLESRRKE
jgi:glycosyltransferase involved in cell wall biosynthesis